MLFNSSKPKIEFNRIGSKMLDIYNIHVKKVGLSNFDGKRYILEDGINELAYGHYSIIKD